MPVSPGQRGPGDAPAGVPVDAPVPRPGDRSLRPRAFRKRLREDLTVLILLKDGVLTPQIAGRLPLTAASQAMQLAESHTAYGKIVLIP